MIDKIIETSLNLRDSTKYKGSLNIVLTGYLYNKMLEDDTLHEIYSKLRKANILEIIIHKSYGIKVIKLRKLESHEI